ncbi:MAG: hypothetical protein GKR96_08980 [Gammaproteobacteria bacterium]|nr:hypothetical protein [Gammaproteobacteria bacterium]
MTINFPTTRTQARQLPVLATIILFLLSFCSNVAMSATYDAEPLALNSSQDQGVGNMSVKLERVVEQRKQSHLDLKGIGRVNSSETIKKLQQELETLARDARTNKAELQVQKSLIEDNSVRLYNILIKISNAVDAIQPEESEGLLDKKTNAEARAALLGDHSVQLEQLWALLLLALVFTAPLAFSLINNGRLHRKNILLNVTVLLLAYLILGFGLTYGVTNMGWIGSPIYLPGDAALSGMHKLSIGFMLHQTALVVCAGLFIHTTINQHFSSTVQLLLALFIATLLIPIFSHGLWAEQLIPENHGWLHGLGFIDDSKITTMGLVAAWFAATMQRRLGPVRSNKAPAGGPVYSVRTALLFYLVWLGFAVGSSVSITEISISHIALNMLLAAAAGGLSVFIQGRFFYPSQDNNSIDHVPGGFISGLVAIAACVQSVTSVEALLIGAFAGFLYRLALTPLSRFLGQQTGHAPCAELIVVQLVAGIWGLLCIGLFGTIGHFTFLNMSQLIGQLKGIGIALIYSSIMAMLAAFLLTQRTKTRTQAD